MRSSTLRRATQPALAYSPIIEVKNPAVFTGSRRPIFLRLTPHDLADNPPRLVARLANGWHGSWNRDVRTGYEVICVPVQDGRATGSYEDFLNGFVTPDGEVRGRPVGLAVGNDDSLFVTDDGSNSIWRVSYAGQTQ